MVNAEVFEKQRSSILAKEKTSKTRHVCEKKQCDKHEKKFYSKTVKEMIVLDILYSHSRKYSRKVKKTHKMIQPIIAHFKKT